MYFRTVWPSSCCKRGCKIHIYVFRLIYKTYTVICITHCQHRFCLNKLLNDCIPKMCVVGPLHTICISLVEKEACLIEQMSPVRHPESNPSERVMKEINTCCDIYCKFSYKRLPKPIVFMGNGIT